MKVILTKFHHPTTNLPARMSATIADHSGVIKRIWTSHFPEDATGNKSHAHVATLLKNELGWDEEMICGHLPDGRRAWVFKRGQSI